MSLLLVAIALTAVSGVPGLVGNRRSGLGQWLSAVVAVAGAGIGIAVTLLLTSSEGPTELRLLWSIPGGEFHVALDGLSVLFLLPIFLIFLLGSVYGLGYWKQAEHPDNGRKLRLFYGVLTAGMAIVVLSKNALLFLMGWEVMALGGFFLVATEDDKPPARAAGWLYLAAAHMSALCLFALFALLRNVSGSLTLVPLAENAVAPGLATIIFFLALVGFGFKAGIMPLHVWLPSSHALAPSHVSALLSGVMIKMGIYGLVRVCYLLPNPPIWWGAVLLALGVISGVLGVAFAIGQHDLKRLLAYHSIENIGIIVIGVGLAMLGRSLGRGDWVVLGLGGALLHVWNHALFKSLLFLSAGSVIHAVHTREIDHLGGLAETMPRTALCFLIGAVAICGLPPLNGFVSELLIYLGLFRTIGFGGPPNCAGAAFTVPALALIGALAVACFVKVYGAVFLGVKRSEHVPQAHESGLVMIAPMALLAGACVLIGVAPALVAPLLEQGITAWTGQPIRPDISLVALAPLQWISLTSLVLVFFLLGGTVLLFTRVARFPSLSSLTWGCGYAAPTPRMQYTSSSFAQMLVGLFAWALRPKRKEPQIQGIFPVSSQFHSDVPDRVLEEAVWPATQFLVRASSWFRVFQQGSIQAYLLYIFAILIILLFWR
jgi:formate hydrogenlyase subunit 3/multisubunit Na+/H+ antiporter MnhD subunit